MGEREQTLDQKSPAEPSFVHKRRELEMKYGNLITHIRRWASRYGKSWIYDEDYEQVQKSAEIVTEVLTNDHRMFCIAYRLAVPLDERLTRLQEDDERYPRHPGTHRQIVRTIEGINDQLKGLYYSQRSAVEEEFLQAKTLEEAHKPYIIDERVVKEMLRLEELRTRLMEKLPLDRKAKCKV